MTPTRAIPTTTTTRAPRPRPALAGALLLACAAGAHAADGIPSSSAASLFDGRTLAGWVQSTGNSWQVSGGALTSKTSAPRGVLFTAKTDYKSYRLFYTVKHLAGEHSPCVLFFGTTQYNPKRGDHLLDAIGGIQFAPPSPWGWDYRPGVNAQTPNFFYHYSSGRLGDNQWVRIEVLVDEGSGLAQCAGRYESNDGAATVMLKFQDRKAGRPAPIGLQIHNSGISDQYRDLTVEELPDGSDTLVSTGSRPIFHVARAGGGALGQRGSDAVDGLTSGAATTVTYRISNGGYATGDKRSTQLELAKPTVSNLVNCAVTVGSAFPANGLALDASATFTLAITPLAAGNWSCAVAVRNSDVEHNPYQWAVHGSAKGGGTTAPGIVSGASYTLAPVSDPDLRLDVAGGSAEDGANVQQWPANGRTSQSWKITAVGGGYYTLTAACSGEVLDVAGASTADGANVQQFPFKDGANQKWKIENTGGGRYRLSAEHSGLCLDVDPAHVHDAGGDVRQAVDHGGDNQRWLIEPAAPSGIGMEREGVAAPPTIFATEFIPQGWRGGEQR